MGVLWGACARQRRAARSDGDGAKLGQGELGIVCSRSPGILGRDGGVRHEAVVSVVVFAHSGATARPACVHAHARGHVLLDRDDGLARKRALPGMGGHACVCQRARQGQGRTRQ